VRTLTERRLRVCAVQEDEPGVQEQALNVLTRMAAHQTSAFSECVPLQSGPVWGSTVQKGVTGGF
jgi:hypothetical protein